MYSVFKYVQSVSNTGFVYRTLGRMQDLGKGKAFDKMLVEQFASERIFECMTLCICMAACYLNGIRVEVLSFWSAGG